MYTKIIIAVSSAAVSGVTGYFIGRRNKEVNRVRDMAEANDEVTRSLERQRAATQRKAAAERDLQDATDRIAQLTPDERIAREQAIREKLAREDHARRVEHMEAVERNQRRIAREQEEIAREIRWQRWDRMFDSMDS